VNAGEEGLRKFAGEIAEILAIDPLEISGESRLVADLDFDSLAFVELGVLLMQSYGSRNFMTAIADQIDVESLTVRSVYEGYASGTALERAP
jgi:acyl carrier protein